MKKLTRKLRKAVKAEIKVYNTKLELETNKRRQAEQTIYDLNDELKDMTKTIKFLTGEKAKALDKVDEELNKQLELSVQLQDKEAECKDLKVKVESLSSECNDLSLQLKKVSKTSMSRLNTNARLEKNIDELRKQLDAARKPWYKKVFKK